MPTEENLYCFCGKPATWVRYTQFSGNHPFCTEHAKLENDFGKSDPSYFFWKEIPADEIAPEHRTTIDGYEEHSQLLCERIHRLRYDKVAEFYQNSATELRRQAEGDRERGRKQLAALLEESASTAKDQHERFAAIWELCEPHMTE